MNNNSTLEHFTPTPVPQRYTWPHVSNNKCLNYILLADEGVPENYEEACQTVYSNKWELVKKDEMKSLISNQT